MTVKPKDIFKKKLYKAMHTGDIFSSYIMPITVQVT